MVPPCDSTIVVDPDSDFPLGVVLDVACLVGALLYLTMLATPFGEDGVSWVGCAV